MAEDMIACHARGESKTSRISLKILPERGEYCVDYDIGEEDG
jgi:hypothetical protein